MVSDSTKCAKQQILIQLWLAQSNSDSSNVNEFEHDGEYTVTANESDNQHECERDIADEDGDSSDEVDGNKPQKAKITKPSLFKVIGTQTEKNKFTYKCPSYRVTKEKFDCATPLDKKLPVEYNEQV